VGAEFFADRQTDRQTDRLTDLHDRADSLFSQLCICA